MNEYLGQEFMWLLSFFIGNILHSSKFQFYVIELSKIKSTKGKARKQELYRWAKLISASTWEEVREESEGNHYMEKSSGVMSSDK